MVDGGGLVVVSLLGVLVPVIGSVGISVVVGGPDVVESGAAVEKESKP